MKVPSFLLVLSCALASLVLLLTSTVLGFGLPGGRTLDFVFTQAELHNLLNNYSAEDIASHRWITSRVDLVFPLAFGAFFYFASVRYANTPWVFLLILWVIVGIIFDFSENAAQMKLLNGEDAYSLKVVYTRAKFVFLAIPIVFCVTNLFLDLLSGGNRKVRKKA